MINSENTKKQKILIVDDSEMNRSILTDMLDNAYEIIEAVNGLAAIAILQKQSLNISVVLLDIVMPLMDGFEVLSVMNQNHWIENIPVIMISAEKDTSQVERAYDLGVTDFITRPFDMLIVRRRVINTILLYSKQKKLLGMLADQIYEKERQSSMMVDILSHIVEFRNGESGVHIVHVRTITEMLLKQLRKKTEQYPLSDADISLIGTASALHDIGKIAIREDILNKPGRLTEEEFEIMKTHSLIGAEMLKNLPTYESEPLVKTAYQICRWHHERYDGRGYPDGLAGDDIPISAQIVALADVYDALTSERCYKKAFSHETAIQMILDGQCGTFNPMLLDCLQETAPLLVNALANASVTVYQPDLRKLSQEITSHESHMISERSLRLLDHERMKYNFFAAMTEEIQFEYTLNPCLLTLSSWGAKKLGTDEIILEPHYDAKVLEILGDEAWMDISKALRSTTPESPIITYECPLNLCGQQRWYRIIAQAIWAGDEQPVYTGAIGKCVDIHNSRERLKELEKRATHDTLTGLLNHSTARELIQATLEHNPNGNHIMVIFDLDHFKDANDRYGHMFGDQVLKHMAEKLCQSTRHGDILARVGGDEFLIFMEYKTDPEQIIGRIFNAMSGNYEEFPLSVSMGIAITKEIGNKYEELFHAADQALYHAKRTGRSQYCFYDDSIKDTLSAISSID